MKVQYQIIEDGSEIELFTTKDHSEANSHFGEFKQASCRTVGNEININGQKRKITNIAFCMDYVKNVDLKLIIEVEQI